MNEEDFWKERLNEESWLLRQHYDQLGYEMCKPSAIYKPRVTVDGDMWCALYGDNLQDGVAGFGKSPAEAMADFDKNWNDKLAS